MAIYHNREVTVVGPNIQANSPETINVEYKDGTHENVPVAQVFFTEEEKTQLNKDYPSKYADVQTVKPEDLDAVRTGVAPSFDPSYKEIADRQVQAEKQAELLRKNTEAAKAEAEKQASESQPTTPAVKPADQVRKNQ